MVVVGGVWGLGGSVWGLGEALPGEMILDNLIKGI